MNQEELDKLREDADGAMKAIDILTNRMIDLAIVENKMIEAVKKVEGLKLECLRSQDEVRKYQSEIDKRIKANREFFRFRFKWMEKLIMKHRIWW